MIEYNEDNLAKIREVAEDLRGTCTSLDDALQAVFGEEVSVIDFDIALLRELDDITMECQGCNWWCETHELDENQFCDDCRDDEDEE
jgi:hypothetical protein